MWFHAIGLFIHAFITNTLIDCVNTLIYDVFVVAW